ncbi:MAG: hypothetical protein V3V16_15835 [Melioribacteraceae bacterium]
MPIVITSEELITSKNKLQFKGFFVDTNIVILKQDPFGESNITSNLKRFESVQVAIQSLKSSGFIPYSTLPVILEYYKHIQYNSYTLFFEKQRYDPKDFKYQKKNNLNFQEYLGVRLKLVKRIFNKTFPLSNVNQNYDTLFDDYNFIDLDFGDHLLINIVSNVKQELKMIFSNDKDFYSLTDDYFLITTNRWILNQAKSDRKLYSQKF